MIEFLTYLSYKGLKYHHLWRTINCREQYFWDFYFDINNKNRYLNKYITSDKWDIIGFLELYPTYSIIIINTHMVMFYSDIL